MKTKTRKILALIILAIMVLTMVPVTSVLAEAGPKPEFTMAHNQIMKRDATSTLDVTVNEKLEFNRFEANLGYNDQTIEIIGVETEEILSNNAQLELQNTGNKITGFTITSNDGKPIEINAGKLLKINVKVKADAEFGRYPITWDKAELLIDNNKSIAITTIPGSIIVVNEGTNIEKAEFVMTCNQTMYPGEEQTISVTADDKMEIAFIDAFLLYDEDIEVVNVDNGKDLPSDAQISIIRNATSGLIVGFSIQSDNVININPNNELVKITVRAAVSEVPEEAEFAIDWNGIFNQDWKEVIADDTIVNINVIPHVTIPTIEKAYIRIDRNELLVGDEEQVQVVVEPEEAANQIEKIQYSTSNPAIATISEKGIIKAITPGKVRITAVINDQFTSEVEVTVSASNVPATGDTQIVLFTSIMILSLVGISTLIITRKRK